MSLGTLSLQGFGSHRSTGFHCQDLGPLLSLWSTPLPSVIKSFIALCFRCAPLDRLFWLGLGGSSGASVLLCVCTESCCQHDVFFESATIPRAVTAGLCPLGDSVAASQVTMAGAFTATERELAQFQEAIESSSAHAVGETEDRKERQQAAVDDYLVKVDKAVALSEARKTSASSQHPPVVDLFDFQDDRAPGIEIGHARDLSPLGRMDDDFALAACRMPRRMGRMARKRCYRGCKKSRSWRNRSAESQRSDCPR